MLLGAAVLLMTFISDYANRAADQALDRLLSAAALSIAGAVLVEDGAVVVEMPFAAFAMVSGEERVFLYRAWPARRTCDGLSRPCARHALGRIG